MKLTFSAITLLVLTNLCFGQFYQSRCDLVETCSHERSFTENISNHINSINSDTTLVVATYGGVGCHTSSLVIFYRKNGRNKFEYYKDTKRQRGEELDSDYEARIESFFTNQLYLSADTIANKYVYIDDGASHLVLYRIGDKCGTYYFYPEYNESVLYDWLLGVRYARIKE